MATVKHINIHNSNYNAAVQYLTYQHNELTKKPILSEDGKMIERENYLIDGINCSSDTYGRECAATNRVFGKNTGSNEVKAHHYIVSFDPDDKTENGLTMEHAHELCLKLAEECFPGHQVIVCTHPDGHNGIGNIHSHIVLNSVRKLDIDEQEFTERTADLLAGNKHHCSEGFMKYFKQEVMEVCEKEGLYQIDLLSPAKVRITDREYWAQRKGQAVLDKENTEKSADGIPPKQTIFETEKGMLRSAISAVMKDSHSIEEFERKLLGQYGIEVHESRGRFSYLTPDRNKPITGRNLGTNFEREYIELYIRRSVEKASALPQIDLGKRISKYQNTDDLIRKYSNPYLERKIENENLLSKSQTIAFMQENGIRDLKELQSVMQSTEDDVYLKQKAVKDVETQINRLKKQKRVTGQYFSSRKIYQQYIKSKNKEQFRKDHDADLRVYETSRKILNEEFGGQDLMQIKQIDAEIQKLSEEVKPPLLEELSMARKFRYKIQIHESNFKEILRERSSDRDNAIR